MVTEPRSIKFNPRIKELSYSSLLTLHACPRRFQLDKLMPKHESLGDRKSVTFAFGHAVGEGIQQVLVGKSFNEVLWAMFLAWDYQLLDVETNNKKSFHNAVLAVEKFIDYYNCSDLSEYEVAIIEGKPATELSFVIDLPNDYRYRGFIDVVLQHKVTRELLVLELKTTGFNALDDSIYKNSSQALGYTIILDTLQDKNSVSFEVRYLVYKTGQQEFEVFNFVKLFNKKVDWIRDILMDCEFIEERVVDSYFPMRGESCYSFFRQCEYFQVCNLSDKNLRLNPELLSTDDFDYTIKLSLLDIIENMETGIK